jgi:hypothetical protein
VSESFQLSCGTCTGCNLCLRAEPSNQ